MIHRICFCLALTAFAPALRGAADAFGREIKPLLEQYCFACHGDGMKKGEINLDQWQSAGEARADRKTWERVITALERKEMPPHKKAQPTTAEREKLVRWIEKDALACDCDRPDPGRVTLRRLNRAEYNHTIHQLFGIDFRPGDDFPLDDSGYGFDNLGDALSLPPVLMEKYLAAADRIVDAAFGLGLSSRIQTNRYPVDLLEVGYNAKQQGDGWVALNSIEEDDVAVALEAPAPAEFVARVRAYAKQDTNRPLELTFMLDQHPVQMVHVQTNRSEVKVYAARVPVPAGKHRLRAAVRRIKDGLSEADALRWKSGPQQKGAVILEWLEIQGPYPATASEARQARKGLEMPEEKQGRAAARKFISDFGRRAYRRGLSRHELTDLVRLAEGAWARGSGYREGLAVAAKAALVSPHFLFRGEVQPAPDNPRAIHPVNEYALASRLSYFLWSSMPDDELFREAEGKTLRKNLERQVRRMLADPRARALVDNFAGQWLQFRGLSQITPDQKAYPGFDEPLREAMKKETELFFEAILREDRSVLEFLTADYTFVNQRLARHYRLEGIAGAGFQRVSLAHTPRRGVLAHAGILALTSNPTRTSPVKRGKWVLENLLNAPPPAPPPEVPLLKEGKELTGTLRQRMEQHRDHALCASCHARMDPIGFGLENFDGIGAWRDQEGPNTPVNSSGELTTGEKFSGPIELVQILAGEKKDQFVKCLVEKMLTYALGRGLEYYDRCAVNEITKALAKENHRFSALVLAITRSAPFQLRRGDGGN